MRWSSIRRWCKRFKWTSVITALQNGPRLCMALDWVSAVGGSKIGFFLLYEHPGCDWKLTLANPLNHASVP
eukprot:3576902-Prorocentrum_lima.AAC.1